MPVPLTQGTHVYKGADQDRRMFKVDKISVFVENQFHDVVGRIRTWSILFLDDTKETFTANVASNYWGWQFAERYHSRPGHQEIRSRDH